MNKSKRFYGKGLPGVELGAMQGYGPVLMAGAEVIEMVRSFDIQKTLNTFHYRARKK